MALYHKWDVKNGFAYVLQFFSLISDDLGGVAGLTAGYNSYVQCTYNVNCVYYIHSGGTCGVRYLDRE